jgi:excisionase family DNA binding protein
MTVREAALKIGVSASLVYELCRQGVLRHTRHGRPGKRGTIRISEEAVAEYVAACQQRGRPHAAPFLPQFKHLGLP